MKQTTLILVFLSVLSRTCIGGEIKYPAATISEKLKENADAVVRLNEVMFTIPAQNRATEYCHEVITILNSKGKDFAKKVIPYDKLSKISQLKAVVYDAAGNIIKRLKNSEIYDQSFVTGYSLYEDNRIKYVDMSQATYPYTVEFEYERELKYLFDIPSFYVLTAERVSVEKASFLLSYKSEFKPRYITKNTTVAPVIKIIDAMETVAWTFESITSIKIEPLSPPILEQIPVIMAAPSDFSFEGYSGNMNTWDDFGKWIISLNKGRNVLPEATRQKLKEVIKGADTKEEKVRRLYEYLQNKTRYVSIQLGIGGFQPFEAKTVDQTGYGDCKALSNYMVTMLNEIGIKAHYVLIKAGDDVDDIDVDFPSTQFNHACVCVPNEQDTIWLECTSQTGPFGYAGTFTGDRNALVITESGAKIVHTPSYAEDQNIQSRIADVYVESNGDATTKVQTIYSGLQYENNGLDYMLNQQYDEQKRWVLNNTKIPNFDLDKFTFSSKKERIPSATVALDLTLRKLASVSGKRMFITPNLMNRSTFVPEKIDKRRTEVVRDIGYVDVDTIKYHLPENVYPEFLPEPTKITSRFGEYETSYLMDQGNVIYVRRVKVHKGRFPADSYQELTDFYKSINKSDNTKLVFLNKT